VSCMTTSGDCSLNVTRGVLLVGEYEMTVLLRARLLVGLCTGSLEMLALRYL
jgi:hypothetical protein